MAQTAALIDTLKLVLKASKVTYADVALTLERSESSIKRKFSRQDFNLSELDKICSIADTSISELVKRMERNNHQLQHLSATQEEEIAADLGLLVVTVSVLNRWQFDEIMAQYTFGEHELIQMLAKLDRARLIELQPGNRIKVLVAAIFSWLPGGPIEQMFLHVIQKDFFAARFAQQDHELIVFNGMLSETSNTELRRRLKRVAQDFEALNQEDATLPLDQRRGYTLLLALRDWRYQSFEPYRRDS